MSTTQLASRRREPNPAAQPSRVSRKHSPKIRCSVDSASAPLVAQELGHENIEVVVMIDDGLQVRPVEDEAPAVLAFPRPTAEVDATAHHKSHSRRRQGDKFAVPLLVKEILAGRVHGPADVLLPDEEVGIEGRGAPDLLR